MALKKGDIIDESVKSLKSCRLVVKVLEGGAGFKKIDCCGLELTESEKVESFDESVKRFAGKSAKPGVIIDEGKNHPDSCGLTVEIIGGGRCLKSITCCGNTLSVKDDAIDS